MRYLETLAFGELHGCWETENARVLHANLDSPRTPFTGGEEKSECAGDCSFVVSVVYALPTSTFDVSWKLVLSVFVCFWRLQGGPNQAKIDSEAVWEGDFTLDMGS